MLQSLDNDDSPSFEEMSSVVQILKWLTKKTFVWKASVSPESVWWLLLWIKEIRWPAGYVFFDVLMWIFHCVWLISMLFYPNDSERDVFLKERHFYAVGRSLKTWSRKFIFWTSDFCSTFFSVISQASLESLGLQTVCEVFGNEFGNSKIFYVNNANWLLWVCAFSRGKEKNKKKSTNKKVMEKRSQQLWKIVQKKNHNRIEVTNRFSFNVFFCSLFSFDPNQNQRTNQQTNRFWKRSDKDNHWSKK